MHTFIEIHGCIQTGVSHDTWLDDFIEWLEIRGESFGGGTRDVTNEGEANGGI